MEGASARILKDANLGSTLQKCPICRANRANEDCLCRRCGSDLTWVLEAQRLGRKLLAHAVTALAQGDRHRAVAWARRARLVHATPLSKAVDQFLTHSGSCHDSEDQGETSCPSGKNQNPGGFAPKPPPGEDDPHRSPTIIFTKLCVSNTLKPGQTSA
ncbi:MAG: hypothetical protein HW380_1122 [Magnetococcales bacterium]|nr:hypothetical protein [Magnetococcales bacterium]